jgi:neutral ceramidase
MTIRIKSVNTWLSFTLACAFHSAFTQETHASPSPGLRVGAAAIPLKASDDMVIGGSIFGGKVKGQEGELRATAVVLEQEPFGRFAIVACDILMINRDLLDPVLMDIEIKLGIPNSRVLINCTHTHHAPSTVKVHGYDRDPIFCKEVQRGIFAAVKQAVENLSKDDCEFRFHLGREDTVGRNSRFMMPDGQIRWSGSWMNAVRPTGPFDPELPSLSFHDSKGDLIASLFNHSTHTIGFRRGRHRSPAFYGLAAQELEQEKGGVFCFLEGASGSTHRLSITAELAIERIKNAVADNLEKALPREVARIASAKRLFSFRVRFFDEEAEERAVTAYCRKSHGRMAESVIKVFRDQRKELESKQGETRQTWLQVMAIGDVAIVGVPGEFFTKLGLDIKNRSPFRHTYIAELANDWIGYLPDRDAHKLGGYQCWTGLHSYAEPGTGERIVDEAVDMLLELAAPGAASTPAEAGASASRP